MICPPYMQWVIVNARQTCKTTTAPLTMRCLEVQQPQRLSLHPCVRTPSVRTTPHDLSPLQQQGLGSCNGPWRMQDYMRTPCPLCLLLGFVALLWRDDAIRLPHSQAPLLPRSASSLGDLRGPRQLACRVQPPLMQPERCCDLSFCCRTGLLLFLLLLLGLQLLLSSAGHCEL